MELGPKNHDGDGLLVPNSIIVVYMDPLLGMSTETWYPNYNMATASIQNVGKVRESTPLGSFRK